MGDRAADLLGGALHVHMDPLMVAGGLGELVHPLLGDLDPVRHADFLTDQAGQILEFHRIHRLLPKGLKQVFGSITWGGAGKGAARGVSEGQTILEPSLPQ